MSGLTERLHGEGALRRLWAVMLVVAAGSVVVLGLGASSAPASPRVPPPPNVQTSIIGNWVYLEGWTPGSVVQLDVGSVHVDVAIDGSAGFPDTASVQFAADVLHIVPGMWISASDGTTTKTLDVAEVTITGIDMVNNVVTGRAPVGAEMMVYIADGPWQLVDVTADASGNWRAEFAVALASARNIFAAVIDEDGDQTITEGNAFAGLTAEAGGPYTVPEGARVALAGSATGGQRPYTYQWQGASGQIDDPAAATANLTGRDDGQLRLTLVVTDASGATASDEATVMVTNMPPVVSPIAALTGPKGKVQMGVVFTDPGRLDTHTARIAWGDGSESAAILREVRGTGAVVAGHQYVRKGTFTVALTVRDDDGGQTVVQRLITVH